MSGDLAISVSGLSKRFRLSRDRRHSFKERIVRGRPSTPAEFWALRDVSFQVKRGSFFGIVGHNGSGKSTALKVLAGIYRPTSGHVAVEGRISALLELGAGFHPELTGRENIQLNGSILGMTQREIRNQTEGIIEFAGIRDFIDEPVKVYSSGMAVRLGFAVAVKMEPEVLIVDEVIAVGDEQFQRKCFDYLFHLRQKGTTIVLVTHTMGVVENLCDEAVWLEGGRVADHGPASQIVHNYIGSVNRREAEASGIQSASTALDTVRVGTGEVVVTGTEYLDRDFQPLDLVVSGELCRVRVHYTAAEALPSCEMGLSFHHESGVYVAGPNTRETGRCVFEEGAGFADFEMDPLLLLPGTYLMSTAIAVEGRFIDFLDRPFVMRVRGKGNVDPGLVRLPGRWTRPGEANVNRP